MKYIIYNSNKKILSEIVQILKENSEQNEIIVFEDYNKNFQNYIEKKENKKIYILHIEEETNIFAINIAKNIRIADWTSIIIFTIANESLITTLAKQRVMFLSVISIFDNFDENLKYCIEDIETIFNISTSKDILYVFSKDKFTYIVSLKETIKTRVSAYYIAEKYNLVQTHKSYYVNFDNIIKIDFNKNCITFKNNKTLICISSRLKSKIKRDFSLYKHNI